ncbi:thermostable hemolysin [Stenotrophomonas sp. BIGb0135]|uniref:thermostable hemolysin n=1 Tax=Stenotrophomonas sp. BIGb0135 TaxID=2940620 RepID=UPI00286E0EC7|nr:thermostable hemolysin [Stenotrophomonas sp. BIGb0135]
MLAMSWIPTSLAVTFPSHLPHSQVVGPQDPSRSEVEQFIARVYRERYGATLHAFLPQLLAFRDGKGNLVAAVGIRVGSDGPLFVEQYLDEPVQAILLHREIASVGRDRIAEIGNFAATTPGVARELIVRLTDMLHAARVRWVLFAATQQLRNTLDRLQLVTVELGEADPERLAGDASRWGSYYETRPKVVCGNVSAGRAFLHQARKQEARATTNPDPSRQAMVAAK